MIRNNWYYIRLFVMDLLLSLYKHVYIYMYTASYLPLLSIYNRSKFDLPRDINNLVSYENTVYLVWHV